MADWGKLSSRGNVEDRRALGPAVIGGISTVGLIAYVVFNLLSGASPTDVINELNNIPIPKQQNIDPSEFSGEDSYEVFTSTVLGSVNDMWLSAFSQMNNVYTPPKLVLFRQLTESACGTASSEVGPHYCPFDETIYLDETFFDELATRLGASSGDVAQAYVIAHEVGHHTQNLLGLITTDESNAQSIAVELQADCFAGLWASSIKNRGVFEVGEISEALSAVAAVGDDRIQKNTTGRINPETWTHGSSQDRLDSFTRGYDSRNLSACNL